MKNFVQPGVNLTLNAPYAVASGDGALIGSIFGVAAGDAENGAEADFVTEGVFTLPKVSTDEFAIGDPAYWDDANKVVTAVAADGVRVGVAVSAAANPSATVQVKLSGIVADDYESRIAALE